jgi:hypothetical protein
MTEGLDAAERNLAELEERIRSGGLEERTLLTSLMRVRAYRGDEAGYDAARARLESAPARSPESGIEDIEIVSVCSLVLGRTDEAVRSLVGIDHERVAFTRLLVALHSQDRAGLERALEALPKATTWEGPYARGMRSVGDAGARLLASFREGDLARYMEGLTELQASRRPAEWSIAAGALARIAGTARPDVRDAIAATRSEMERIGAWACVRLIDDAVTQSSTVPSASGADRARMTSADAERATA